MPIVLKEEVPDLIVEHTCSSLKLLSAIQRYVV